MPWTERIERRQDARLKVFLEARNEKTSPFLFLEGLRLVEEALNTKIAIESILVSSPETFPAALLDKLPPAIPVHPNVMEFVSDMDSPPGVIALVKRPVAQWDAVWDRNAIFNFAPIMILDGLQDPGNASTIIRTAEASGARGLITTPKTSRLTSPKALRGAMGSCLRVPYVEEQSWVDIEFQLKPKGYTLLAASSNPNATPYDRIDWRRSWAIVLGREGDGVSTEARARATMNVRIPMQPTVNSLNVGAAAAILLYESARIRGVFR